MTTDPTSLSGAYEPFTCRGRTMGQPQDAPDEGYVACYRAGHSCPPKVAVVEEDAQGRLTTYRCPCCGCGDHGISYYEPREWLTAASDGYADGES